MCRAGMVQSTKYLASQQQQRQQSPECLKKQKTGHNVLPVFHSNSSFTDAGVETYATVKDKGEESYSIIRD